MPKRCALGTFLYSLYIRAYDWFMFYNYIQCLEFTFQPQTPLLGHVRLYFHWDTSAYFHWDTSAHNKTLNIVILLLKYILFRLNVGTKSGMRQGHIVHIGSIKKIS